jgi:hypothetical protein
VVPGTCEEGVGAGLAFGAFEYAQTREVARIGPLDLKTKELKGVAIPPLASGAVAAVGAVLLFAGRKRYREDR